MIALPFIDLEYIYSITLLKIPTSDLVDLLDYLSFETRNHIYEWSFLK